MVFEECAREMPKVKIQPAMAFLGSARQYHGAAEQLSTSGENCVTPYTSYISIRSNWL
jgi:hypothetical protein